MNKYFLLFFIGFAFVIYANPDRTMEERTKMNKMANETSLNFSKKMKEKFNFELLGMGGSGFHDLNTFSLHFKCPMVLDLPEARNLILEVSSEFLHIVNSNNDIKPYLRKHPFDFNNIKIILGFKKNNSYPTGNKIAFISFNNGKIYYDTYDHEKKIFKDFFTETYDEALQIVLKENNSDNANPLRQTQPPSLPKSSL